MCLTGSALKSAIEYPKWRALAEERVSQGFVQVKGKVPNVEAEYPGHTPGNHNPYYNVNLLTIIY